MAAHAVDTPEVGRSALDAAQLMDVGVNYLRNHIVQEARVHGVITGGGKSPNIVPDYAQVWYYVRAPSREQVDDIYSRVLDIAKGAALMTGTTYDIDFLTGCYDLLPNETIGAVLLEKLKEVGAPKFTDEERDFARQLQKTLRPGAIEMSVRTALERYHDGVTREELGNPFCEKIIDPTDKAKVVGGSTDVGDVSYITPTAQISTCCCKPLRVPGHSWQKVVAVGSSIGMKGMMVAAKAMALATLDLATKPEIVKAARDEFEEKTAGKKYVSALPGGTVPH